MSHCCMLTLFWYKSSQVERNDVSFYALMGSVRSDEPIRSTSEEFACNCCQHCSAWKALRYLKDRPSECWNIPPIKLMHSHPIHSDRNIVTTSSVAGTRLWQMKQRCMIIVNCLSVADHFMWSLEETKFINHQETILSWITMLLTRWFCEKGHTCRLLTNWLMSVVCCFLSSLHTWLASVHRVHESFSLSLSFLTLLLF